MKSRSYFAAAVCLCLMYMSLPARADTVFLKNGKTLEVETSRLEGDQVCFVFKGMPVSLPQSKVVRLEKSTGQVYERVVYANQGSADSNGAQFESDGKLALIQTGQTGGTGTDPDQPRAPPPGPLVLGKGGLKHLPLTSRLSKSLGMEPKATDSGLKDVVEYVRPRDLLKLGDINLTSVIYAFWRGQLYTISIWTKGQENFNALRSAAFAEFGEGTRIDGPNERYLWTNDAKDIMLKYTGDGKYGLLWMRSKELDRSMKLSTLNHHTTFMRRMRSVP